MLGSHDWCMSLRNGTTLDNLTELHFIEHVTFPTPVMKYYWISGTLNMPPDLKDFISRTGRNYYIELTYSVEISNALTHYQMTNFRLFQTKRLC